METNTETKKSRRTKIVQLKIADAQTKFQQAEASRLEAEEKAKQAVIDAQQAVMDAEQEVVAAEQAAEQARLDELQNIEEIRTHVTEHCTNEGYFCGIILNQESLLSLIKFALDNPTEQIKIPFQLYTIEEP
jgi:hypothetical protein